MVDASLHMPSYWIYLGSFFMKPQLHVNNIINLILLLNKSLTNKPPLNSQCTNPYGLFRILDHTNIFPSNVVTVQDRRACLGLSTHQRICKSYIYISGRCLEASHQTVYAFRQSQSTGWRHHNYWSSCQRIPKSMMYAFLLWKIESNIK